jgi:hypothetical protein
MGYFDMIPGIEIWTVISVKVGYFDTGSLLIKLAYRYKWVISIQVPYIDINHLSRYMGLY